MNPLCQKAIPACRGEPGSKIIKLHSFPPFEAIEVERVLEEHPKVLEAVVLQRYDTHGRNRLYAYILTRSQEPWGGRCQEELKAWVRKTLKPYMAPSRVRRVFRFPLLPSGLVDRKQLALMRHPRRKPIGGYRAIPAVRAPWSEWRFEGVVTAWHRNGRSWQVELAHREERPRMRPLRRLKIEVPPKLTRDIAVGNYLAMEGHFSRSSVLVATAIHRTERMTRIGLEDTNRVLGAL